MKHHVLTLPENTKGRDFVVGDLHGAYELLDKALKAVKFDPEKDRLISVGDLIDRGPQPERCLELLKQPWFFAVKGNHETMFLDTYKDGVIDPEKGEFNKRNGMGWIFNTDKKILDEMWQAFHDLPVAIEIPTPRGTVGFVHAEVKQGLDWPTFKQQVEDGDYDTVVTALWGRKRVQRKDVYGVEGVGRVFFGHTPQKGGAKSLGNCFYVDTGAVFRLINCEEEYSLTISDIMTTTVSFNKQASGNDIDIHDQRPEKTIPFAKITRKKKP